MPRGKRLPKKRKNPNEPDTPKSKKFKKDPWTPWETTNPLFSAYYQGHSFLHPNEQDAFLHALREELPTTLRINESSQFSELVRQKLEFFGRNLVGVKYLPTPDAKEEVEVKPPVPVPWFPAHGRLFEENKENETSSAWEFSLAKRFIKKNIQTQEFHQFLLVHNSLGTLSRQEVVSMLPPLFLNVQPHHYVLDMCAAPGSKTTQLIEHLHRQGWGNSSNQPIPSGFVIANDSDPQRCHTLATQLERIGSPCVLITNHQAQFFPSLFINREILELKKAMANDEKNEFQENVQNLEEAQKTEENVTAPEETDSDVGILQFDRILCDVPCSGDGTLRKNPDIWQKWHPGQAFGIHQNQFNILWKAFELTKVGGRIVYSTCSLNPVENEAVVAAALERAKGCLKLVNVEGCLPGLKRRNGISQWKIMDREGKWYQSWEELPATLSHLPKTIFSTAHQNIETFHLERCFRILPHEQDTGGFFVAVLEKVSEPRYFVRKHLTLLKSASKKPLDEEEQKEIKEEAETEAVAVEGEKDNKKKKRKPTKIVNPEEFFPLPQSAIPYIQELKESLGISDEFSFDNLCSRQSTSQDGIPQKIFYLTSTIKQFSQSPFNEKLKVLNTGVKLFQRLGPNSGFRLCQTGVPLILPFIKKRIINIQKSELVVLTKTSNTCPISQFEEDTRKALLDLPNGPCLFSLKDEKYSYHLSGSKGNTSCTVYIASNERKLLLQAICPEFVPEQKGKKKHKKSKEIKKRSS